MGGGGRESNIIRSDNIDGVCGVAVVDIIRATCTIYFEVHL